MLRKLLKWNRERKQWNDEHNAAWSRVGGTDESGLSLFQKKMESLIESILDTSKMQLMERRIEGENEIYISATVPELEVKLWIYEDQTEIRSPGQELNLESWDTKTPEEHYSIVEEHLKGIIESRRRAV